MPSWLSSYSGRTLVAEPRKLQVGGATPPEGFFIKNAIEKGCFQELHIKKKILQYSKRRAQNMVRTPNKLEHDQNQTGKN